MYAQENREDIWLPIVTEHADALHSSGLSAKLSKTYIGIIGSKSDAKRVSAVFKSNDIKHQICAIGDQGWEQLTQNKLYEFSLNNAGYVLYSHTKGAGYSSELRNSHRRIMNENLIWRWSENVDLLRNRFCATGIFFLRGSPEEPFVNNGEQLLHGETNPCIRRYRGFFAGNFWWSNLSFIKEMGYPSMENRIKAEAWMNNLYDSTDRKKYMVYDMLPDGPFDVLAVDNKQ